ncbi:pyridoxamine 5'-phosphate oxidase family protein [Ilyomonas limi]|uniref:Pyridoxamine 5'-phosphate oxidase family protein n=1 Tax=Ilyomonas limi TaxID=2575867 RepID=A0A4V6XAY8_9BACT|nr:pyridoxamine 5'-phosphate oxidase family protein [Ilyomonas limi]TKK71753.1 pyridoxamine 5'-phosphate oxidase family protein [Ilyomonas limi]
MFGKLEAQEIEVVLSHQYIGRLGCSAGGRTYVVPISYAYDGAYIYAHTHEGKKIEMMRENPEVCFQADTMENMASWKSVICWGSFEEVTDEEARTDALKKLLARELPIIASQTVKLTPSWPFQPHDFNVIKGIVFRILITEKTGRFENIQKAAEMNTFV